MPYIPSSSYTPSTATSTPTAATGGSIWPTGVALNGSESLFDGSGGPALIIVFVAVGLLVGAFVALIILRRGAPPSEPIFGEEPEIWYMHPSEPATFGEEPKLYAAQLELRKDAGRKEYVWDDILPVSVKFIPDDNTPLSGRESIDDHIPHTTMHSGPIVRFLSAVGEYYVPTPATRGTDTSSVHHTHIPEKSPQSPTPGTLQIAVAIAMPRASSPLYYGHDRYFGDLHEKTVMASISKKGGPEALPEVSLGLTEVHSSCMPA